jgi:hypothetical protein
LGHLLRDRGQPAADAALEFLAGEAGIRAGTVQLQAVEAACAVATFEDAECTLSALGKAARPPRGQDTAPGAWLRCALSDRAPTQAGLPAQLEHVASCWERFDSTRRDLAAATAARCRLRIEGWYHSVVEEALEDACTPGEATGGTPGHLLQLERHRLLAILGRALRRQDGVLDAPDSAAATHTGAFDIGAIGHLLALRGATVPPARGRVLALPGSFA